jgi:hypothetical protein
MWVRENRTKPAKRATAVFRTLARKGVRQLYVKRRLCFSNYSPIIILYYNKNNKTRKLKPLTKQQAPYKTYYYIGVIFSLKGLLHHYTIL